MRGEGLTATPPTDAPVHARDRLLQPLALSIRKEEKKREEVGLIVGAEMILRPDIQRRLVEENDFRAPVWAVPTRN